MVRVLLVEDDPEIARAVCAYLRRDGHLAVHADHFAAAEDALHREQPELLILDLLLPGGHGFQLLDHLATSSTRPAVIILSASGDEATLVTAFRLGADDYVTKPFRPAELMARVGAVGRRLGAQHTELQGPNGICVDLRTRRVQRAGHILDLTAAEYEVYVRLVAEKGAPVSRERLATALGLAGERAVDSHIHNLRRKLGESHGIRTVFGLGYRVEVG
ncbi:response regulator transcription factor [Deinococcus sp. HMF7604]|uniref:response regulator transcription factor n=1 Tax=Deinococcus betulae TaxID=2873312 RepID=UPI001CCA4492|nr:response regulator transcription factor [Deinococcus betulae]MBZ9752866.1 response regulator transcription factor [Deinococcus betulae]